MRRKWHEPNRSCHYHPNRKVVMFDPDETQVLPIMWERLPLSGAYLPHYANDTQRLPVTTVGVRLASYVTYALVIILMLVATAI